MIMKESELKYTVNWNHFMPKRETESICFYNI